MKTFIFMILSFAFMISTANAVQVYERVFGDWYLHGHQQGSEMSCVASTAFTDGTRININVFPRRDGSQYTTMTVSNPQWYFSQPIGSNIETNISFVGSKVGHISFDAHGQVYSKDKIIFRDLNENFGNNFRDARHMILFPDTVDRLVVSLAGTSAMGYGLADCINIVKSSNY